MEQNRIKKRFGGGPLNVPKIRSTSTSPATPETTAVTGGLYVLPVYTAHIVTDWPSKVQNQSGSAVCVRDVRFTHV